MSLLFSSYSLHSPRGDLKLTNRIVIAPMCQYSSQDGLANDWHLMHWGNLLNSGAGLFMIEATAVSPVGRITPNCLGLWNDKTAEALQDNLNRARRLAPPTPVIIQLAHAGRKGSCTVPWEGGRQLKENGWQCLAPSDVPFADGETSPMTMNSQDMQNIENDFVQSARYADEIGVEGIELHFAHGYLLHQFLSPLSNKRQDGYGGNFESRIRYPLQIFKTLRKTYSGVLGIRISATDWMDGGWTPEETADFVSILKQEGLNFAHITSGGLSPLAKIPAKPLFQLPFARLVKEKTLVPTIAVGMITSSEMAESALQEGGADMIALARGFLFNPRWAWQSAVELKGTVAVNPRYSRALPQEILANNS